MILLVYKSALFSILQDIQEDVASMKQSEMPSGRNCRNKKACGDELWVCQVKIYSVDQKIKSREKSQYKAKIQAKIVCRKKETWRINPEIYHLPEFLGNEDEKLKEGIFQSIRRKYPESTERSLLKGSTLCPEG